ncbi:hypothetical protein L5D93_13470 [Paenibacillus thiaminolyticus]|nr:hypothetical protein [Paenibacillus thiaminolyticus]
MTEAERYQHLFRIGILTDNSTLYDRLSVQDSLELFSKLYQVPASRVPGALEQVNLADDRQTVHHAMDTPQLLRRSYADATITVTSTDGSYQVACGEEGARRVSETMTSGKLESLHSNESSLAIFL